MAAPFSFRVLVASEIGGTTLRIFENWNSHNPRCTCVIDAQSQLALAPLRGPFCNTNKTALQRPFALLPLLLLLLLCHFASFLDPPPLPCAHSFLCLVLLLLSCFVLQTFFFWQSLHRSCCRWRNQFVRYFYRILFVFPLFASPSASSQSFWCLLFCALLASLGHCCMGGQGVTLCGFNVVGIADLAMLDVVAAVCALLGMHWVSCWCFERISEGATSVAFALPGSPFFSSQSFR